MAVNIHRLVKVAHLCSSTTQVPQRLGVIRLHCHSAPDQLQCAFELAGLMGNHPQIMQCLGVVRLPGEDLPIDPLRSLQPARLVMPQGKVQRLLN